MATYLYAESVVSSNERPFDLRCGTVPLRWCHGVTLKFFEISGPKTK
jgi:hypothetical protein